MAVKRLIRKTLGIDLEERQDHDLRTSGNKAATPFEEYLEEEPTVGEWVRNHMPTRHDVIPFMASFFPFTSWIGRYNTRWLLADAIAGVTLGLVVIPQAMAYALLVGLSPEYGLYTSFTGAALYWLFGTSKDVAIGATAVVSLLVGKVIDEVLAQQQPGQQPYTREEVAKTHAFLAGCVLLVFGLLRLDWLVEFIPHVAIAAFVTGAAITISLSQLPALLGLQADVNSKNAAYRVFVDTCRALPQTRLDAAIGVSGLVLLALIKWYCDRMAKRDPRRERMWNMFCSLRLSVTILLFTLVSFLVNRKVPFEESKFRILGQLPRGFIHSGPPSFDPKLVLAILPQMPPTVIILLIEHIAIGKSFGRLNEYVVVPSQELMSIAFTNLTGPFVGAYASTGSFSGTAILSKAGVRTPLAGVFNGLVLVLALYVLTSVLYYIPLASLSALIIHAVYNLITPPRELVRMWRVTPPDVVFYFVGVLVSVFNSLENGIYVTVGLALALLLLRIAKANGQFLGRVTVYPYSSTSTIPSQKKPGDVADVRQIEHNNTLTETESKADDGGVPRLPATRDVFFRLDHGEAINPQVAIVTPYPGVFVFRFYNGLSYLNQAQLLDNLASQIMKHTRRTTVAKYAHKGDRPWNEPSPSTTKANPTPEIAISQDTTQSDSASSSSTPLTTSKQQQILPTLRAIVLDCATVHHTDSGAVEGLVDLRAQLDRWAAPDAVEWHFANLRNRWTRRAFAAVGFGRPNKRGDSTATLKPGFSLAARYESEASPAIIVEPAGRNTIDEEACSGSETEVASGDVEEVIEDKESSSDATCDLLSNGQRRRLDPVTGTDRPYFHVDLAAAVEAATRHAARGGSAAVL
ncbi:Sulfate permease 2 [Apiospora arundinis]|uniref:Sulfate permease 2 n=1 Tax=Apiospora arundinis TaxID=335852 RepID=A0ABR2JM02_9PEZI